MNFIKKKYFYTLVGLLIPIFIQAAHLKANVAVVKGLIDTALPLTK